VKVTSRCYAVTGLAYLSPWSVNAGFVVGDAVTLVVDTGGTLLAAQTIHGYAQSVRPQNKITVVNTERHLDHVGGNGYFREKGCPIYGHTYIRRLPEHLLSDIEDYNASIANPVRRAAHEADIFYAGTHIENPDNAVDTNITLDLGGLNAQLIMTPGHTNSNLTVYIKSEKTLFCGDCLVTGYIPNLESGDPAAWESWLVSLAQMEELEPAVIVPGHGQVLMGTAIGSEIERHRRFLYKAIANGNAPTIQI
jgi:glyoxylase-like metal-dependent hydrolase (beta-lactamase superfamily II)